MVCKNCKEGDCEQCVDVLRSVYSKIPICQCIRKNHAGEPVDNQIIDPFTESVYGPEGKII